MCLYSLMRSFSLSVLFSLVLLIPGLSLATGAPAAGHSAEASAVPDAVTGEDDPPGIVMLVRRPQHVRAAVQTVRTLAASNPITTPPAETRRIS